MTSPLLPGGADSASRLSSSTSTPSIRAAEVSTLAALSVHTSGRNRPVASANPAIVPDGSRTGRTATANTVPEVPIDTTTSPGRASTPSADAALSPAPGPSVAPQVVVPAGSLGASTWGSVTSCPNAQFSRSRRYSPVSGDQ